MLNKLFRGLIGLFLILLGLCSAIFSTYATIIPISLSFKDIAKIVIIGIFIIVQVSVFFLTMTKNYIAKETPQHYLLINRISNMLMLVSIVSTITFFNMSKHSIEGHKESIIDIYRIIPGLNILPFYNWIIDITINIVFIWSVCIILDVLAIKMPLIGFDIMMGIKEKRSYTTMLSMIIAILTHKPKTFIENKYSEILENNQNKKVIEKVDRVELEQSKNRIKSLSNLDQKYNKIKDFLEQEYKPNQFIKSFQEKFKLTITEYRKISERLKKDNIIYTDNRKTYLKGKLKLLNQGGKNYE